MFYKGGNLLSQFDPKAVHLLERDGLHILFCKDSLEFFEISKEDADAIRLTIIENKTFIDQAEITEIKNDSALNILQLNVSEDCNLHCKYCVADGGNFGRERKLMTPEIALRGLKILLSHYKKIKAIQFFGGEPLLNLPTIKTVVEYLSAQKDTDPNFSLPMFNINTNGTILNREIISLIKKYSIVIVISLDGPEFIHDQWRKTRSGKRTFQKILKNINTLYQETGQPSGIELVFGTHFLEQGWGLRKSLEYLEDILPTKQHTLFAAPLLISENSPEELKKYAGYHQDLIPTYRALIRKGFAEIKRGSKPIFSSKIEGIITSLMKKQPAKYFCLPSKSKLMIDASGNFIPCNAFVDKKDFIIGDVNNPDKFKKNIGQFEDLFLAKRKTIHYKDCAQCWAFNLCTFCLAHLFQGETPKFDQLDPNICLLQQAIVEEVILQISSINKIPADWKKFEKFIQAS